MSRVVIAPDSFKGTIGAAAAAEQIAAGWRSVRADDEVRLIPMADGGEGTLAAFTLAMPMAERMPVTVHGPDGRVVDAAWLRLPPTRELPGGVGVVELASTSGIEIMGAPAPLDAHTLGFGEAIAAALDAGVDRLLLAIGSSASSDGGAGVLVALGARLLDAERRPIVLGGRGLAALASVDLSGLRALPRAGAVILSDVTNPLLGTTGAATVFGPQKGASASDIAVIEAGLEHWSALLGAQGVPGSTDPDAPGAGAAGGTGFGLLAWGARIAAGSAAVGDALGLPAAVAAADLVITGEGRFDSQSLAGKVPSYILGVAAETGVGVALVAGAIATGTEPFAAAVSLSDLAGSSAAARADPARWLREAGAQLAVSALVE